MAWRSVVSRGENGARHRCSRRPRRRRRRRRRPTRRRAESGAAPPRRRTLCCRRASRLLRAYLLVVDRIQKKEFGKHMGSRQADMPTPEVLPPHSSACSAGTSRIEHPDGHGGSHSSSQQQQARAQQEAQAQEVRARTGPADTAPRNLDSALEAIRPVEPDAIPQRGGLQPFNARAKGHRVLLLTSVERNVFIRVASKPSQANNGARARQR